MIESPVLQELLAEQMQKAIVRVLTSRFTSVPSETGAALQPIQDPDKLDQLLDWAVRCPSLEAFRSRLSA